MHHQNMFVCQEDFITTMHLNYFFTWESYSETNTQLAGNEPEIKTWQDLKGLTAPRWLTPPLRCDASHVLVHREEPELFLMAKGIQ